MIMCPMSHVANPAQGYGNVPCESPEDDAPAGSRRGRTGAPASNRAIASSECCSIVRQTRTNAVCRISGRSNLLCLGEDSTVTAGSYRMYSAGSFPGAGAMARLQGLRGKAGSTRPSPRANVWKGIRRNAQCQPRVRKDGNSEEAIVPVTSLITRGEREGPPGPVAVRSGRAGPILPCSQGGTKETVCRTCAVRTGGTQTAAMQGHASMAAGRCAADVVSPDLKPYWGNPAVRNFRGADGN